MSMQDEEIIAEFEEVAATHADGPEAPQEDDDIEDEDEDDSDED
jgi:hypothetical protein